MTESTIVIECGAHQLYYATDPTTPGIFIAAPTEDLAKQLAEKARQCLPTGRNGVSMHIMHDHLSGSRITVPEPDWMSADQRKETIERLREHIQKRFLS